ncbi:MAG: PAS domain S-box protein, partial [Desulfovibrionaceae bacterium]
GVWELGDEGSAPFFAPQWLDMLGYEPGEAGELPDLADMLHPEDRGRVLGAIARHLAGETEIFDSEHRLLCKDGDWKWVQARGVAAPGQEQGRSPRMVGVMFDVHDQKVAELELQASEARHRDLFEQAPIGIYTATAEGDYITINPRHAEVYGYASPEDMLAQVGNTAEVYARPEERQRLLRLLERSDVVSDFECQVRKRDGSLLWTSRTLRAERDADGRLVRYMAFVQDIQAAKQAEEASDQARRQLLGVMEQLEAGVYVVDPAQGRVIYANPFLKNALGFDMVDRSSSEILEHGEDCPFCLDETGFIQFGDARSRELRFRDGRWYLCQAKVAPWPGLARAVLVVATDITEIKQAQDIREDVDRIMRHDLKSPLSGILTIPDLILGSVELPEEEARLLSAIKSAGRKMLGLIDSSLVLYELEMGKFTPEFREVDLVRLFSEIVDEVHAGRVGYGVSLQTRLHGKPFLPGASATAHGDFGLLYFMFANLVKNAMEATPPGGVVAVDLDQVGDGWLAAVHNPTRVPTEMEERFFEKYATAGKSGGTGLGTYSALLIARAHGGDIAMRTSDEEGTTVSVTLPRPTDESDASGE